METSLAPLSGSIPCLGNPFENFVTVETKDRVKYAFMSIFVVPVRIALGLIVLAAAYIVAAITLLNVDLSVESPLIGWRRLSKDLTTQLIVLIHFIVGFCRVRVRGRIASPTEAPILVMAPHCSFLDAFPLCCIGAMSVVSKKSIVDTPFIGSFLRLTVPITVDRDCKNSRSNAMRKLRERARKVVAGVQDDLQWPQIALFPEGTCTNRSQLISFKPGAFAMSLPVQPVCFKWPNKYDTISWTWDGENIFKLIWLTLCQTKLSLEIEFLPVYVPDEAEKNDPALYAENVRAVMARCLRVPMSNYSVDDAPYLSYGCKPRKQNFVSVAQQLGVSTCTGLDDVDELKLKWRSLCGLDELRRCNYCVTIEQFCKHVKLSQGSGRSTVQRLFNMFDWQCRGRIDLREFLVASCCTAGQPSSALLEFSLTIFTDNGRRPLSEVDFVKTVRMPLELSVKEARDRYAAFTASGHGFADQDIHYESNLRSRFSFDRLVEMNLRKPTIVPFDGRRRCIKVY